MSIGIDDPCNGLVQVLLGDMPLVNERHLPPVEPLDGACGLGRAQVAAVMPEKLRALLTLLELGLGRNAIGGFTAIIELWSPNAR